MKKTLTLALLISILLMQTFINLKPAVGAEGCSVAICDASPPGGVYPEGTTLHFSMTVTWSIPDNTTFADVAIGILYWTPKLGWQGGSDRDIGWFPIMGETVEPPWTCDDFAVITIGETDIERYKFTAWLWCQYTVNDEIKNCTATDEREVTYSMATHTEEQPVNASFTMDPESPTVNDTITFMSTSTCVNGTIVEYEWYLNGNYRGDVGNKPSWNWIGPTVGIHTVELTVVDDGGNMDTAQKTFEVEDVTPKQLSLTASSDKSTYITREKIIIKGKLTFGGKPVDRAQIDIKVHRSDGTVDSKFSLTEADGSYTAEYEVPAIPFKTIPPSPEDWTIKIFATPAETEYGHASTTLTVKVLPIYLKLHSVHLVQVVEPQVIRKCMYLAAGKKVGLRVMVSCPSLKGAQGFSEPEVCVKLDVGWGTKDIEVKTVGSNPKTVTVGPEPTPVDFIFTLDPGTYSIGAYLDPHYEYMLPQYSEQLYMDVGSVVKVEKMKSLTLAFVAINILPNMYWMQGPVFSESWSQFYVFCEKETDFVRDVYPTPKSMIAFRCIGSIETGGPKFAKTIEKLAEKTGLMSSRFHPVKFVSVEPPEWFKPETGGYCLPRINKKLVHVKYGTFCYVTGHEIAHLFGLRWKEEYDLPGSPLGIEVDGLILKDGKIFNMSVENDRIKAYKLHGMVAPPVHCMMGCGDIMPWICTDCYRNLIESLADPPTTKSLFVTGMILKNGSISKGNWYLLEDALPDQPFNDGIYTIQCLSPSGEVLYNDKFGETTQEDVPFAFTFPFPDGTARVVIKKDSETLKEVIMTPNIPSVKMLYPNGGENIDGAFNVTWDAEDADGDPLAYAILYSQNGEDWTAAEVGIKEKSYALNASELPGGSQCLIKVIATDGLNTGQDVSDGFFTVSDKAPIACITLPGERDVHPVGEEVSLSGFGYDPEDLELTGSSLQWSSSIDGTLGLGDEITISNLSPGTHEITLTVTDSTGKTAEATVAVTVEKISAITVVDHLLCKGVDNDGNPAGTATTFQSDETVFSWLTVMDGTQGDEVYWLFQGPNGVNGECTYTLDWNGEGYCCASLDLNGYNMEDAVGDWSVRVSINGVEVFTDYFTVEPLTGLVWWGPTIGLLIIAIPVSFAIIIIILINRRKT